MNRKKLTKANSVDKISFHRKKGSQYIADKSIKRLMQSLDNKEKGYIFKGDILNAFHSQGIGRSDPRLSKFHKNIDKFSEQERIDFKNFKTLIEENYAIIEKALTEQMIIPSFLEFCKELEKIYEEVIKITEGNVADYIPQLKLIDPEQFALSICTIDGQRFSLGDHSTNFALQSVCKPINYCLALEEHGEDKVHYHVGREPSGHSFNELKLNSKGIPHNPMINSGAIMCCSLMRPDLHISDRFDFMMNTWKRLTGGFCPRFNNPMYLSEKDTADRNFALGYFMKEKGTFPKNTNLIETLEFYFQCCSIELNSDALATVGATLANAGICPITEDRVFHPQTVLDCLSLMYSCGMYDFSGEFAFKIGLPAKSGVSGSILVVVPNIMGIAIWSPRLDNLGNSVRGIEFCSRLVKKFYFHNYDNIISNTQKIDPRRNTQEQKLKNVFALCSAASTGDINEIKKHFALGNNLNECDYDKRTPLHLAASEGKFHVVEYLVSKGVDIIPKDRWGNTPVDEAIENNHKEIADYLKKCLSEKNKSKKKELQN